jgi:hypothetical protein
MYRSITLIYIALYGCFVIFARQPDYFDGEITTSSIHILKDSASNKESSFAAYSVGKYNYVELVSYPLLSFKEGDSIKVIYDSANPKKAVIYSFWGYWIRWDELLVSLSIYIILFFVSVSITSNPHLEQKA